MSLSRECASCKNSIPPHVIVCPHCGKQVGYPNVDAAADARERDALQLRYGEAFRDADSRGVADTLKRFEHAMAGTVAVMARSHLYLQLLVNGHNEIYSTYYKLTESEVRLPEGDKWDVLRGVVDSALFPNYREEIRFAALSLDGVGLSNYGDCSIKLRTDKIAHRATVFEENSITFMDRHNILVGETHKLPRGYRATWDERARLCVAKLYKYIDSSTQRDSYANILLHQGATSEDDQFVEAHIYGPMTALTIEEVIMTPGKRAPKPSIIKDLGEKLKKAGAALKVKK
jgi:hypothetical protein